MKRKVLLYKNHFLDFYKMQDLKVQKKIEFVIDLIRYERIIPQKFFKKLKGVDDIYEIRVITYSKNIRILCFVDNVNLIVLLNCFIKKSQEIPKRYIETALKLKIDYLKEKENTDE